LDDAVSVYTDELMSLQQLGFRDMFPVKLGSVELRMNSVADRFRACSERQRQIVALMKDWRTGSPVLESGPSSTSQFEDLHKAVARPALSPFDDLIAAVTAVETAQLQVQPNSPRFMVRVVDVGRPHRSTKRNYDYFEELDATLAERSFGRRVAG
jgi:hypothetical protein